ncbi:MAG: hypothetical protein QG652_115 [Pseudomonadota bacterium]|nr:hypothetical protein [Pseudomonadota bacterium]
MIRIKTNIIRYADSARQIKPEFLALAMAFRLKHAMLRRGPDLPGQQALFIQSLAGRNMSPPLYLAVPARIQGDLL